MGAPFPFNLDPNKYSRQLWSKQAYLYIAEFFRTAKFDAQMQAVDGNSVDDYRFAGAADDWRLPCGGSGGQYTSYFRLIDITDEENGCRIAVTNGESVPEAEYCGTVKINGGPVDVATFISDEFEEASDYWIWIHSWRDLVDGYKAEIRMTETDFRPDNPNGGIAYASEPVGYVYIESDGGDGFRVRPGSLRQDFLKGGDHLEILASVCYGEMP